MVLVIPDPSDGEREAALLRRYEEVTASATFIVATVCPTCGGSGYVPSQSPERQ